MTQIAQARDVEQTDIWGCSRDRIEPGNALAVQERIAESPVALAKMVSLPDRHGLNAADQALANELGR